MRGAWLLAASLLGAGRALPDPPYAPPMPTYAYYVDPTGIIDLRHPLPLKPFVCGPTPLEVTRGWYDAERGLILVCSSDGGTIPIPGPYWVLVGRVEAIAP